MSRLRSFGLTRQAGEAVDPQIAIAALKSGRLENGALLGYGNGRSYGDSCLNRSGRLVPMQGLNAVIDFDPQTGVLTAEAGIFLSQIIHLAAPHGWFPAVVPGTQFVTLGGAIANDIHGKNHHRAGSFGCHVEKLTLLRSDGAIHHCSATSEPDLFAATIGGMGLTGLILSATIRLMRIGSLAVEQSATPFDTLGEYFDLAPEVDRANDYAVAWIDQLAGGARTGRGVLLAGNHAANKEFRAEGPGRRLSVPFQPPCNVLSTPFLKLFNRAYYWMHARKPQSSVPYQQFFFPLDGVRNWNRLYGPNGLLQHQSVVPEEAAREIVPLLLAEARQAGHASFLTVLKRFGTMPSPGLLSFPRPGYTLTLDFPDKGSVTRSLFDRLDAIALDAGGAINPYKDARMAPGTFARSFPNWGALEALRDPVFLSDFWRRTALSLSPDARFKNAV